MTKITNFVWNSVDDCVISELDGTGAVQAVYTNEPQQYGGVISQRRGTTTSTYHADALGSTRFLTDSSGNVTDTYLNDAWGNSVDSTGTTVNPFKWIGKYGYYTDDSTGQVYVRARMYQPAVARWASMDPLYFVGGLNVFAYVYGRSTFIIDPAGTVPNDENDASLPQELRECRDRTTWKPEYCEGCSVCRCNETRFGTVPYPENYPWGEIFNSLRDSWGKSFDCELHVKIADCGMNAQKIAWTCAKTISGKTHLFICLPNTMTTCEMKYTFPHEAYHALQKCQNPEMEFWPKAECVRNERPAWEKQCEKMREINCCDADPSHEACKPVEECVTRGVNELSCNEALRSSFDPCNSHVPLVWPEFKHVKS